ncbi:DUF1934 domain-containing protein [Paenibacillus sp. HJGM_3]|uniref:DUF1934 domain-containing protein n=1 Tax=Paenibacillus sp. HJGM_3 TaxID=3379816 RepID=UPI003858FB75
MTIGKKAVRIRIESQGGGQTSSLQAQGEWYTTPTGANYVRYPEPDPAYGRTTTTVKWSATDIRVLRHGDVESDQTFVSGVRMTGSYKLPPEALEPEAEQGSNPEAGHNAPARPRSVAAAGATRPKPKRLLLETVTRTIAHRGRERGHSVKWKYELYVDGQFTGIYKLRLDIEELD